MFLRKGPSVLPQSSLSLSFLPLCQPILVSSPTEVSVPALLAPLQAGNGSPRSQTLWVTVSELGLQNHREDKAGGGQSPLQPFG